MIGDDEIHENHKNGKISPFHCPACDANGRWRRGHEFEGEKICLRTQHHAQPVVWIPQAVRDWIEASKPPDYQI